MSQRATILARNLSALGLESHTNALTLDIQHGWRVDWTDAWPGLSVETEPGKWVALGSRRAPVEEARAQLAEVRGDHPWPPLVVLLGAGLGYAIDIVEADPPPETSVLVIEPFAASASAMLARRDWTGLVDAGRLVVIVGPAFDGATDAWRRIEVRKAPALVVAHPALARVRPDAIAVARRIFDRALFDASANAEARETLGGRYLVNTLRNLPRILAGPDLRTWANSRTGQPAVVCGAGPSLNRNLRDLGPYRDRAVLIAVDTALRPILEAGVEPDLVVALDPSPLNARHLSGLRLPERTWLVSEAALDPAAFDSFGDRIAFFRVGDNDPWPWLGDQGVDVPVLAAWGSVLTSTFALAEWLGCDPVLLVGSDLAYTGGQPYCRGTTFEMDWARAVLEGQPLPVHWRRQAARRATEHLTGFDGAAIDSAPHLVAFRDWLVDRAAKSGRRVVNLTGTGILTGGGIEQGSAPMLNIYPVIAQRVNWGLTPAGSPMGSDPNLAAGALAVSLGGLREDEPSVATWMEGYARSLDRSMLDLAIAEMATYGGPNSYVGPNVSSGTPTHVRALIALPESVAIIRAVRDGGALPLWAAESGALDLRSERPADVSSPIQALMRLARLGAVDACGDQMTGVSGHLHMLYDLEWPQATLEAVSALLIETSARLRSTPRGASLRQRVRGAPPATNGSSAPGLVTSPRRAERRAQAFAVSAWATGVAALEAATDPVWRTLLDALDAANVALDTASQVPDACVCVTVSHESDRPARAWRSASTLTTGQLAGTLRGALLGTPTARPHISRSADDFRLVVAWRSSGVDRDTLHRQFIDVAPHRVLTDEGLPKCLIATAHPDIGAIVTPRGQLASFRVGADGAFEPISQWPSPITGEVHGRSGAVAWTSASPTELLFRETPESPVAATPVPFQTYTAIWWQNRVLLTADSGVWSWQPGEAPQQLASLPPGVIVDARDDVLHVDPLPLVDGRLTRIRLTTGWNVEIATGHVRERSLLPPGQAWSEATGPHATATTFPQADVLRLVMNNGQEWWLVWPSPRAAVWVGNSLVLNSTDGTVVVLTDMVSLLEHKTLA